MIDGLKPYPEMKDSGVAWLGHVPKHWQIRRGKWLFRKMDRPVRPQDEVVTCFRDGVVTLRRNRRTRGFTESLKEIGYQGIRRGDLVIHEMDAFAGSIGVSDAEGKGTPVYAVCSPASVADAYFYAYVLREMARSLWIQALAKGIRERSTDFRFEDFGSQPLPLPPIDEQLGTVRFLEYVDRRVRRYIRAKQSLVRLLDEQKEVIIRRAITRGLDAAVRRKPSGIDWLGDIPEHWEVVALKRILHRLIDCEHKTAPASDDGEHRVVRTTAVRSGRLRWEGTYCTTDTAFSEWTRRGVPEPGDVIFTREAPAGEACVVPDGASVCLGQRTVLMKLRRDEYCPDFLVHMIYAGPPRDRIRIASQGSTVGHFNMDDIGWMHVLKPRLGEQRRICDEIREATRSLDETALRAEHEITLLRELWTRLAADVVTGKVDVREVAARLPYETRHDDLGERDILGEDEDPDVMLEEVEV